MLSDILVSTFAIAIGIAVPSSFVFFEKLTRHLSYRRQEKPYYRVVDALYGILLPVLVSLAAYILPGLLVSAYLGEEDIIENNYLFDLYLILLSISYFVTLGLLIKTGKLRRNRKD